MPGHPPTPRTETAREPRETANRGFVTSDDGYEIFFRTHGSGSPPMVCCNGLGVSTYFWHYLVDRMRDQRSVTLWDYRGHGRSQVPPHNADLSIPRMARDMWAVVDRNGLEKPILLGHSMGVQVILEAYRQRPDQVGGLVPILGTYKRPLDSFYDFKYSRPMFEALHALGDSKLGPAIERWVMGPVLALPFAWDLGGKTGMIDSSRIDRGELRRYLHHLVDVGFPFFIRLALQIADHDATDVLPGIQVPTLIVAGEYDTFTPIAASYHMRDTIEGAELLFLEGATHAGIVERPDEIYPRVEQWLADHFGVRRES
jgi:pimeloyl-ACP methyl ester carboxylesterase